jgi:hypothetical protein
LLASGSFTDRNRLFVISRCPHRQESPKRKRGYMAELVCGLLGTAQLIKLLSVSGVPLVQAMAINYSIGYSIQFYINWFADRIGEWSLERAPLELMAKTKIPTPMKVDSASNAVTRWCLLLSCFVMLCWVEWYNTTFEHDKITQRHDDFIPGMCCGLLWHFALSASTIPWLPCLERHLEKHTLSYSQDLYYVVSLGFVGFGLAEILLLKFGAKPDSETDQTLLSSIAFVLSILVLILLAIAVKRDTSPRERWHRFWTAFILFANIVAVMLYFMGYYNGSLTKKPAWADFLG